MITALFVLIWAAFAYFMTIAVGNYYLVPIWIAAGYLVAILGIIIFLLLNFPIFKYTKVTNKYKSYVTRSSAFLINHLIMRLQIIVKGKENIPSNGLLTIYANHKSYADPFILLEIIKRPTTFTPKMAVYKLPLVGLWLKYLGAFPIDRSSDRNTARAMVDAIRVVKQGMAMCIFPEGGIKDRDQEKMVALRAGAYRVAMKARADILPLSLGGTIKIKYRAPFRRSKVSVIIHPVIKYEEIKDLTTLQVADKVLGVINNHL